MGIRVICLLLIWVIALPLMASSQSRLAGTWFMQYKPWPHIPAIDMKLRIADPTAEMLYPAKLELIYGSFRGEYELLLVKKNEEQLAIGRNKYPVLEEPFGLGPWMMYLNGVLEYQEGEDGPEMVLKRLWLDNFGIFMRGLYDNEFYTNTKVFLRDFMYREDIALRRVDGTPWTHPDTWRIVNTDTIYYGVYDPIVSEGQVLSLAIQDEERYDRDTVTIVHNGNVLADRIPLEQATALDIITLDSGENYLAFFADNYGDMPPNTANFIIGTPGDSGQLYGFNFSAHANAYATVMVARFQYQPVAGETSQSGAASTSVPDVPRINSQEPPIQKMPTYVKGRRDQRIGQLKASTRTLMMEIRDEQMEDGDIISLEVNGAVITERMEVNRQGRRFGVSLQRGRNRIVFRAENLGRIPPNTAVLIIHADGKEQKFHLSTDFTRNNVLDVVFDKQD